MSMVKYEPLDEDFDIPWTIEPIHPEDHFVYVWDRYGFFTHISVQEYLDEVFVKLPDPFTEDQLHRQVRMFLRKFSKLYCCIN